MNLNPEVNMIVFEVKRLFKKELFTERVPTRASGGIRSAWRLVQSKTGAKPTQVLRLHAEWQADAEDAAFIRATLPHAEFTYSFTRPANEMGWAAAFQEAARAIQTAADKQMGSRIEPERGQGQAALFPVLRSYAPGDVFMQIGVYRPIATDLAVYLAHVGMTPRNTIGIDYVMRANIDASEQAVAGLFDTALQNLRMGLQVNVSEDGGEKLFAFIRPGYMAASALCLPDFYQQVRSWLGEEVFVAFPDPDNLFVTLPQTRFAQTLRQTIEQSNYWGSVALTPACYLLNASGLRQVAARAPRT